MRRDTLFGLAVSRATSEAEVLAPIARCLAGERPGLLVTFVNPYSWRLAETVTELPALLDQCDLVLPDGIGVVKAMRWVNGVAIGRFSFDASSLYLPVFRLLNAGRRRLFVIGARPGVAGRAVERMRAEFTDIELVGCLDGFVEHGEALARIAAAAPDLVLCGMGAPHQERFLLELRRSGFTGVAITCGGFLDQLAEKARYYPRWVDRLEMRWLWRICKEPRRLWRRYAVDYLPFIRATIQAVSQRRLRGLGRSPTAS